MITRYNYIYFKKSYSHPKRWDCHNNKSDVRLGSVEWYGKWNQYCFSPAGSNLIFNDRCLLDIVDFIGQLKKNEEVNHEMAKG